MTQTVLDTGASSGIGKGTALLLQREGFTVFGTARRPDAVGPQEFPMLPLDVRLDDSVKTCFDSLFSKVDRLDVLIDNAGYALTGAAEETTLAEAKAQFETNFFGAGRVVNAALPTMRAARAGKIIIIGSLAGLTAIPFSAFYSATKFALEGYAEALWHELRPFGISVTLVEPGFVRTRLGEVSQVAAGRGRRCDLAAAPKERGAVARLRGGREALVRTGFEQLTRGAECLGLRYALPCATSRGS